MLGVILRKTVLFLLFSVKIGFSLIIFFHFLVFIRTEMSVLCIYLCELFHFMKGVSKSTATVTVMLDLLVQVGLLLQYCSPTHTCDPNPNPKLTVTLHIIHTWSNYAHL